MDGVFGDVASVLIGSAMNVTRFDSASGHPGGESLGLVISALLAFDSRSASELGTPDDEGVVHHAAAFEIGEESFDGFVNASGERAVAFDIPVGVPVVTGADIDELNKTDAGFDKASGGEALPAEGLGDLVVEAVEGFCFGRFIIEIEDSWSCFRHASSCLKGKLACDEVVIGTRLRVVLVEAFE